MIHELKILPKYFADVVSGKKQFEVRKDDRPFHEGDLLALNEFENKMYTGNSCLVYIDYILRDSEYVKADYVILGVKPCAIHRFGTPYNILIQEWKIIVFLMRQKRLRITQMQIPEKIKKMAKNLGSLCVSAYNDYSTALNDCTRMREAENKILSVSSAAFCRCFNDVARQICSIRANKTADTYCNLAETAVELLVSGKGEAETLYYFYEILTREKRLRGSRE